ncbi:phage holin family protein [Curvibacter delicatus]|jgi:uncharacterized membrane protein YqjE|uniref:phage holin family protein n=1 Tax=Curvibacter delicatus TaxID=80879 RepID=UPI0009FBB5FF|nr:phage holin family protein [Curvibacter delicatus]
MTNPDGGLFSSVRQLLATGVETLRVRLELLSTEVEEEKLRLFDAVLWAGLALLLLGMGLLFLCGLIVVLLWDHHRLLALGGLTVIFLGCGYWVLQIARARLRAPGGLFTSSVAELARDHSELARERAGLDEAE